jgi:hypothetical protein
MKATIVFMFLLIGTIAQSQSDKIDSLCTAYDELIAQAIEEELDFYPPKISISSTLNRRAIGEVNHTIHLYFDEHEELEEPETDDEDVLFYNYALLRKVEFIIESGSYKFSYIYYFDEIGFLIRYNEQEIGYGCKEKTCYFDEHKVFKITQESIQTETCYEEQPAEEYVHNKPSENELSDSQSVLKEAEEYRSMLQVLYNKFPY